MNGSAIRHEQRGHSSRLAHTTVACRYCYKRLAHMESGGDHLAAVNSYFGVEHLSGAETTVRAFLWACSWNWGE